MTTKPECPDCGQGFDSAKGLRIHYSSVHKSHSYETPQRCHWCGEWYVPIGESSSVRNFCNHDCRTAWQSWFRRGERHPNYKEGNGVSKDWELLSRMIRARDGCCLRCGREETKSGRKLHVHHIRPKDEFEQRSEADEPTNLVSVCFDCHKYLEGETPDKQLSEIDVNSRDSLAFTEREKELSQKFQRQSDPIEGAPQRRDDFLKVEKKASKEDPRNQG